MYLAPIEGLVVIIVFRNPPNPPLCILGRPQYLAECLMETWVLTIGV